VIVAAILALTLHLRILILAVPLGALALDMGLINYGDVANKLYEYRAYPSAAVGLGLYLVIGGAILAIVAGVAALAPHRWLTSTRRD